MSFQLVIVRGRSDLKAHRIGPGPTVAGRQDGCQLQIKSTMVSRRHCEFQEAEGTLSVKDLNSSNGTLVNGKKIEGPTALSPGDEVSIGGVKFRVERVGAGAPAPAPAAVAQAVPDSDEAIPVEDDQQTVMTPAAAAPRPGAAAEPDEVELDEDDVAEFLLDIDVDDDDKR
jgi:pSer/pThr/pTyr-binding forkhead associated (FHA) protein